MRIVKTTGLRQLATVYARQGWNFGRAEPLRANRQEFGCGDGGREGLGDGGPVSGFGFATTGAVLLCHGAREGDSNPNGID